MRVKVFIDGSAGTTGLRIAERLAQREDIRLLTLPEDLRKDVGGLLERVSAALPFDRYPFIGGKLRAMRG